ncbi:hypothetical protein PINS_up009619 [Pythium insidiosum]|nr:hypothetical protein PINS_up009619 [Pythium insidiosum]
MPLFQHRGSCDCGGLRFFILAPKRVEAFDDSNALSCKKGRFPFLLLPTACFEMIEASSLSLYEPQATSTQHAFCSKCGVHIFHFDHGLPEVMAINVYCVDGDTFEDMKIIFIPKGARPVIGTPRRLPMTVEQAAFRPVRHIQQSHRDEDESEQSTIAFQKQLMLWARMDKSRSNPSPASEDTQSSTSSTSQSRHYSITSEDPVSLMEMKDQLEFYLKRHLDDSAYLADNQTSV